MLSEHTLEGMLEGYLLTGRHGFFSTYEAFAHVIDSMFNQHAKWLTICNHLPWRAKIASLNLLITSGSAQWTLIAPVFVPMLMILGVNPETTQAMYRIADASTNIVTPMSPYFVLVLGFIQRYRKDSGIGTLVSLTLPFTVAILIVWTLFFLGWYALGIPLGPGAPVD